jgi:type VI secretion system protein ImpM
MRCGLYGKLPAKRDFIAVSVPRGFLDVWEPWMQGGISASRHHLGATWQQVFLHAPIWRFWLGAEVCGTTVAGAFMASVDGVGRYYPLTLFAWAEDSEAIPPPELATLDGWFTAAEDFLLATLDRATAFDATAAAIEQFPLPPARLSTAAFEDAIPLAPGGVAIPAEQRPFSDVFATLRIGAYADVYAAATFWWTIGGEDFPPLAFGVRRMPDPVLFSNMLIGTFMERLA